MGAVPFSVTSAELTSAKRHAALRTEDWTPALRGSSRLLDSQRIDVARFWVPCPRLCVGMREPAALMATQSRGHGAHLEKLIARPLIGLSIRWLLQDRLAAAKMLGLFRVVQSPAEIHEVEIGSVDFGAAQVGPAEVGFANLLGGFERLFLEFVGVKPGPRA